VECSGLRARDVMIVNRRRTVWLIAAMACLCVGTVSAILGARVTVLNDAQRTREGFFNTSSDIASTVTLAIEREEDLSLGAGAFFAGNVQTTQAAFLEWLQSVRAFQRDPGLLTIGVVTLVPASQLGEFAKREEVEGVSAGIFKVIPAGSRAFYCLSVVVGARMSKLSRPPGVDYCDSPLGPALIAATDSGQVAYLPYETKGGRELIVGNAIYRGGALPTTVRQRRNDLIGWTGSQVRPSVLLGDALQDHREIAVDFTYKSGSTNATFKSGAIKGARQSTTIGMSNGWFLTMSRSLPPSGIFDDRQALYVFGSGFSISLLLAILVYLLGTSRSLALAIASERTRQLHHQAFHDGLTELPNRALIIDRTSQMLARSRRAGTTVAVFYLDLDDFKDVNDALGHDAGDRILVEVAARLLTTVRSMDTVGRLEGDEFVVVAEVDSSIAGSAATAARILEAMAVPFEIGIDRPCVSVGASIGIAEGNGELPEVLLTEAEIASCRAKAVGKQQAMVFQPSMQAAIEDLRNLKIDLRAAIELEQFFVLYQPTISLSTGSVSGVEALLRWRHPQRGAISPDRFVAALESSGLIIPVGRWVIAEACRQGIIWHRRGHRISVSVNISATQLDNDHILHDVRDALADSGLDPHYLILELTETALLHDVEETVSRLNLLKSLGVRLAIDDFGTGYSSLAYLQQFPFDVLKIDKSFVSQMPHSATAAAIVHTFVGLGQALGLEIVAEGIEDDDQRRSLLAENVQTGQGYLFARPLSREAVDVFLKDMTVVPVVSVI